MPIDLDYPLAAEITRNVAAALAEDIGAGDLTASLIPADRVARARVISREAGVLCGRSWFDRCVTSLDPDAEITWNAADGDRITADQLLCEIRANARALLSAERSALNFLQLLSGTATVTRKYVDAIAGTQAMIVDTRKTLPGLRLAQKYAVRCGGGANHRLGLYDGILIKENHIMASGGVAPVLAQARKLAPPDRSRGRSSRPPARNRASSKPCSALPARRDRGVSPAAPGAPHRGPRSRGRRRP
mgnify:CR=1 FL=1